MLQNFVKKYIDIQEKISYIVLVFDHRTKDQN